MKNITIFGNCAKDAELRRTQSGSEVCGFDVAVNDRRTKETYWFSVSYWGKGGVAVQPYLRKGQPVVVSGEFSWHEYNDKKYLKVNADKVELAGKAGGGRSDDDAPQQSQAPRSYGDIDDEIPF